MRRRNQVFVAVALAVAALATVCTTGESYAAHGYNFAALDKIAVVEVQLPIGGEAARDQIADVFAMELLKKGYQAVERRQVSAISPPYSSSMARSISRATEGRRASPVADSMLSSSQEDLIEKAHEQVARCVGDCPGKNRTGGRTHPAEHQPGKEGGEIAGVTVFGNVNQREQEG